MMKQIIKLQFNENLTKLAGNPFGRDVFNQQVKNIIDYDKNEIKIILPEQIDNIASSFIQGFFNEIVNEIGIKGIQEKITVSSSISNLKEIIIQHLE